MALLGQLCPQSGVLHRLSFANGVKPVRRGSALSANLAHLLMEARPGSSKCCALVLGLHGHSPFVTIPNLPFGGCLCGRGGCESILVKPLGLCLEILDSSQVARLRIRLHTLQLIIALFGHQSTKGLRFGNRGLGLGLCQGSGLAAPIQLRQESRIIHHEVLLHQHLLVLLQQQDILLCKIVLFLLKVLLVEVLRASGVA